MRLSKAGLVFLLLSSAVFARYVDPVIGRWISKDKMAGKLSSPQSLNLYVYVENNPIKYLDPNGLTKLSARMIYSPTEERNLFSAINNNRLFSETQELMHFKMRNEESKKDKQEMVFNVSAATGAELLGKVSKTVAAVGDKISELHLIGHTSWDGIYGGNAKNNGIQKDFIAKEGGASLDALSQLSFAQDASIYLHGCHNEGFANSLYGKLNERFKNEGGFKGKIFATTEKEGTPPHNSSQKEIENKDKKP